MYVLSILPGLSLTIKQYIQENKSTMPRASLEGVPHPSDQSYINGTKRKRIHKVCLDGLLARRC